MPSETGELSRPGSVHNPNIRPLPPPKLPEPLPCPRCDSTNTKFCYYNNYNLSQPRHFCKACRRYWTHGGTLRNVPFGGGTRKNSKRSRSSSSPSTTSTTNSTSAASSSSTITNTSASALSTVTAHDSFPVPAIPDSVLSVVETENESDHALKLSENIHNGNYISLLNSQQGHGFMGMVGYGTGIGYGFYETGKGNWVHPGLGYVNGGSGGGVSGASAGCNTWQQMEVGDVGGGLVDGDNCFSWPGLAISTSGKAFN